MDNNTRPRMFGQKIRMFTGHDGHNKYEWDGQIDGQTCEWDRQTDT